MTAERVDLAAGDYRLVLEPARGGSIARFDWRGEPLMRPTCGPSILDAACFPLVPFSNRIARGRFDAGGEQGQLRPNFPGQDHPHPLHGFGWLSAWDIEACGPDHAMLRHRHPAGEWPWAYEAVQRFALTADGLMHELELRNTGDRPMPAGLGFHPYFPRTETTTYSALHGGEWHTAADGLPIALRTSAEAIDWWRGAAVGSRAVDTVYTDRRGAILIEWPDRHVAMRMIPSDNLPFTVVYSPPGHDFFCVEPVSHETDAINRGAMPWLPPGGTIRVNVRYEATMRDG